MCALKIIINSFACARIQRGNEYASKHFSSFFLLLSGSKIMRVTKEEIPVIMAVIWHGEKGNGDVHIVTIASSIDFPANNCGYLRHTRHIPISK